MNRSKKMAAAAHRVKVGVSTPSGRQARWRNAPLQSLPTAETMTGATTHRTPESIRSTQTLSRTAR